MTAKDILLEARRQVAAAAPAGFVYINEIRPGGELAPLPVRAAAARAAENAGYYRARSTKGRIKALDAALRSLEKSGA